MENQVGPIIDIMLCTGCGACVDACCKGIYQVKNGKAAVINPEDCCGSGECCLPVCQAGAISFPNGKTGKCSCNSGCSSAGCC